MRWPTTVATVGSGAHPATEAFVGARFIAPAKGKAGAMNGAPTASDEDRAIRESPVRSKPRA